MSTLCGGGEWSADPISGPSEGGPGGAFLGVRGGDFQRAGGHEGAGGDDAGTSSTTVLTLMGLADAVASVGTRR